jgi:hypothetical protein
MNRRNISNDSSARFSQSRLPRHGSLADSTVRQLSRRSEVVGDFRYRRALDRAVRSFDDGRRLVLDNIPPSTPCCIAMPQGIICLPAPMAAAAEIYSLIGSAKLNGLNRQNHLADVFARIAGQPPGKSPNLLPWHGQSP